MPEPIDLGEYEGKAVRSTTIAIRNAGDGLSKAMRTDPRILHHGETVFVVLECETVQVRYDRMDPDKTDDLERVHVLKAGTATLVDGSIVAEHIRAQHDRNLRAEEDAKGVQRLAPRAPDALDDWDRAAAEAEEGDRGGISDEALARMMEGPTGDDDLPV